MQRFLSMTSVVAIALLVAPSSLATWQSYGTLEPDSEHDDPNFMWTDAPARGERKIYFNAYPTEDGTHNPNVAALGSQIEPVGRMYWQAILGIWIDCNGDGYVGMAESAVREYRDELLVDKTRCPPSSSNLHNKDGWVVEMVTIGRTTSTQDKRIIRDLDAMVWGDSGRPFPVGPQNGPSEDREFCGTNPAPKGTYHRTGAFLNYADCRTGFVGASLWNDVIALADPGNAHGLALADERNWDESGHALNRDTFGNEDAGNSYVSAQDCSQQPFVDLGVISTDLRNKGPRPMPANGPVVNPDGNVPGTVNRTYEDFGEDCNTANDNGDSVSVYMLEGQNVRVDPYRKTESGFNFNFTPMSRGGAPCGVGTFGPQDCGVPAGWGSIFVDSIWTSGLIVTNTPVLVRQADFSPAGATYWTFYAHVGSASTGAGQLPGGSGVYGAPFCPNGFGTGAGINYGWQCDADKWYRFADGSPKHTGFTYARPGQGYELRDVDCFDGRVNRAGTVGVGSGWISDAPCQH